MRHSRLARLGRMAGAEIRWRAKAVVRNALQRARHAGHAPRWDRRDIARVVSLSSPPGSIAELVRTRKWTAVNEIIARQVIERPGSFPLVPSMRDAVVRRINERFPTAADTVGSRADRIIAGNFDLLGYRGLRFDSPDRTIDWHLDPVHGRRPPRAFWSEVPYLDPSCGDHKIIWELNRHQHLLALGRAWWLTGDRRHRDTAIAQMLDWIDENPPLTGANWASMLELGFRALSWIWALQFFAAVPAGDDRPWLVDATIALDRQLRHVEQNLSHYFSPNTHLLGEALALYAAGHALPFLTRAPRYVAVGRRVLTDQIGRQVARDGGHLERSTHYHRYTLDFYILALTIARIAHDEAEPRFEEAVARLGAAARLLADNIGRIPHIGDDDGGMLFPMCGRDPDDLRDSLAEAGILSARPDLAVDTPPEEAEWLLAHPTFRASLDRARDLRAGASPASAALPDTGYYISRSPSGDHLVVDAGEHGFANGGHAHADALSLTLTVRNVPLLIDPGTGSYTTDRTTRDVFRSSLLHNTVVVDGRSQSEPSGPFHWRHAADARADLWRTNPGFDYLEAHHDGYMPIEHRRHVLALHGDLLIVADLIAGDGVHDAQAHWHLDPRWSVELSGRRALLRAGTDRVELATSRGALEHVRATASPGVGWHAPVYGRFEKTSVLRASDAGAAPFWLVTVFGLDPTNEVRAVEPLPVWAQAGVLDRAVGVRVSRAHSEDFFGVAAHAASAADARGSWRLAAHETDARMLFCRLADRATRVALVDGSFVRTTDRQQLSVSLPRQVPDFHVDVASRSTGPEVARVGGRGFGAQVLVAGRDLSVAVERRAVARGGLRRALAR